MIGLVCLAGAPLVIVGNVSTSPVRTTPALAGCLLVGALTVTGLDRMDRWFARERGDAVPEYQIVAKEDFEFLGWSLVALALWDAAPRVVKGFPSIDPLLPRATPGTEARRRRSSRPIL